MSGTHGVDGTLQGWLRRRQDDWKLQADLAVKEIEQADKQILAAEIRLAIAEREIWRTTTCRLRTPRQSTTTMRDKFTNQELYDWMVRADLRRLFPELSARLRPRQARRARLSPRAGASASSSFIQFGYWDSLKKGLLAGERLLTTSSAWRWPTSSRTSASTRSPSTSRWRCSTRSRWCNCGRPARAWSACPKPLFDLDYPGHYLRRLKSVSVTIPCVTGPYTSVNCTLTLIRSSVRHANTLLGASTCGKTTTRDSPTSLAPSSPSPPAVRRMTAGCSS